jgi:hypothetical protein
MILLKLLCLVAASGAVLALTHAVYEPVPGDIPQSFFDLKFPDIRGRVVDFLKFKGNKAILVVNVACN